MTLNQLVQAATTTGDISKSKLKLSFLDVSNFNGLLDAVVSWVLLIAGIIAFAYLVYSGFIYLTAAGNPDAAKKGQQGILNAIIGIVIIVLAYAIVVGVSSLLEHN